MPAARSAVIVIPARLSSTRLPRKMLLAESGKTADRPHLGGASVPLGKPRAVVVATDSDEIAAAVDGFRRHRRDDVARGPQRHGPDRRGPRHRLRQRRRDRERARGRAGTRRRRDRCRHRPPRPLPRGRHRHARHAHRKLDRPPTTRPREGGAHPMARAGTTARGESRALAGDHLQPRPCRPPASGAKRPARHRAAAVLAACRAVCLSPQRARKLERRSPTRAWRRSRASNSCGCSRPASRSPRPAIDHAARGIDTPRDYAAFVARQRTG
jgi:hypothetical protein